MKYIYYFSITISLLIFSIFMIMTYGGGFIIIFFDIRDGFYKEDLFNKYDLSIDYIYIYWINRLISIIFWGSIFICIGLAFFKKINIKTKGVISLVCLIIILLTLFGPKVIEKVFF